MDRKFLLLCAAAIPLGLAGGYAWSAYTAPPPKAYVPPKATIAPIADSPDEYPAALDEEWKNRGAGVAQSGSAEASTKAAKANFEGQTSTE